MNEDLARRSITSVKWNFISSIVQNLISFVQALVLARLLPVESFGIYAGAASIVMMTSSLANFGMGGAFVHRCEETDDLERTAAIHFTLQLILNVIWTSLVLIAGLLFLDRTEPGSMTAYVVLTLTFTVKNFAATPRNILGRQIQFKRLALLQILDVILTFISATALALLNQPIWALLATNIVNACLQIMLFYFWKPVWRPRLLWSTSAARYFLGFGSKQVVAQWLLDALDKGDELWAKTYLGAGPLGFYSRAYSIAQMPGNILASPMNQVAVGAYAELKGDQDGLSEAYFETNSLLIRSGYILVGILALVAPEFIRIGLGEKWMPMLTAFRLMLPFTMFDPMKRTMASLFVAVGKPSIIVNIRVIQLLIMVGLLFALGLPFGIEGVAAAVDIMMIAGIAMILGKARAYVNLSLRKLFLVPTLGLIAGIVLGFLASKIPGIIGNDWFTGIAKSMTFLVVYGLVLWTLEKDQVLQLVRLTRKYLFRKGKKHQHAKIQT